MSAVNIADVKHQSKCIMCSPSLWNCDDVQLLKFRWSSVLCTKDLCIYWLFYAFSVYVSNFIIFVLSAFRANSLAVNHLIMWEWIRHAIVQKYLTWVLVTIIFTKNTCLLNRVVLPVNKCFFIVLYNTVGCITLNNIKFVFIFVNINTFNELWFILCLILAVSVTYLLTLSYCLCCPSGLPHTLTQKLAAHPRLYDIPMW